LNLNDTEFVYLGAVELAEALNENFTLCKISLLNNQIREESKLKLLEKLE
jgi:hypothetical protein